MISFSKYSGCGNDFIMINHPAPFSTNCIQRLCDRQKGIGADGIIFLEPGSDFTMRIFNRDGSEAEMCGNGLRCFSAFILELGYQKKPYSIKVHNQVLKIEYTETNIKTTMGDPKDLKMEQTLEVGGKTILCHTVDTGVPHAVIFVDSLELSVQELGAKIRYHPHFSPKGINVNFVKRVSDQKIALRTFERGVEAETLACGTGATASAIIASLKWAMKAPISVHTQSNETLEINFLSNQGVISQVTQTGPAVKLFHGSFDIRGYL